MQTHANSEAAAVDAQEGGGLIVVLLLVIPMLATIAFGAVDAWAMGIFSLLAAVVAVAWTYNAVKRSALTLSPSLLQLPLIALFMIGCIQLLPLAGGRLGELPIAEAASRALSLDQYATRFFLVRLGGYIVYFAAALAFINSPARLRRTAVTLVIFGAAIAFFAILQRLANPDGIYGVRPTPQAIPFGPFVNQHHFTALMEMLSGLTLGLLFSGGLGRDKKLLLGMAAAVMGMAAIFTSSRGGLIGYLATILFVAAVAVFFVRRQRQSGDDQSGTARRVLPFAFGGIAVLLLVAGSTLYLGGGSAFLRGIGESDAQTDITSGRTHFWGIALRVFADHPVIGAGLDAFGAAFPQYDDWNGTYRVEQAHNDYLQILADAGVLGFACAAAFIFLLFRSGVRSLVRSEAGLGRGICAGALAGCAGILIHSFFDFPLRTPANAFFFLLLATLVVVSGRLPVERRRRRSASVR